MVTDGFFQWTTAALWLRATRCIPHVTLYEPTAHMEQDAQWYRKAYRKAVLRWVDAICCNGRLCAEYTRSLGFPAERIPAYGHMVADVQGIRRATSSVSQTQINALKAQFDLKGVVFLYVGRLVPLKGIDRLLHAWQRFCSPMTSDGVTLLLVGDGPQRAALDKYCVDHSLHNVRFVGKVDYDALGPYYRVANTFVIPTLSDNWSLVVPEAMAAGLPVLCSQYNGCWPELVTPDNGWVFDPLDEADTVRCLQQCLAAKGRLPAMGSKSLEIVEGGHTPAHAAKAIYYTCQMAMRHCNGSNNDLL
jgi:glycosyltransferase involved in cell wall biosynthesis